MGGTEGLRAELEVWGHELPNGGYRGYGGQNISDIRIMSASEKTSLNNSRPSVLYTRGLGYKRYYLDE